MTGKSPTISCSFVCLYFSARAIWGCYNHWTRINHLSQWGQILGHSSSYHQGNHTWQKQYGFVTHSSQCLVAGCIIRICARPSPIVKAQMFESYWLRGFWQSFKSVWEGGILPMPLDLSCGLMICALIHLTYISKLLGWKVRTMKAVCLCAGEKRVQESSRNWSWKKENVFCVSAVIMFFLSWLYKTLFCQSVSQEPNWCRVLQMPVLGWITFQTMSLDKWLSTERNMPYSAVQHIVFSACYHLN